MPRLLRETLIAFRSSPLLSVLSVLTIAVTLFLLGLAALLYVNLNGVIRGMDRRVQLVAYLTDDAPPEEIERIRVDLYRRGDVKSVRLVGKEEALARFREELGDDAGILEDLPSNPLPPSIEVEFEEGRLDADVLRELAAGLEEQPFVESVDAGGAWLEKMQLVKTMVALIGSVGGAILMAIAVVIIGTAIRMAVFARRTELLVMKMVGSADRTIRGPFLLEGLIKGAVGGFLAATLASGVYRIVDERVIGLAPFPEGFAAGVTVLGVILGMVGTWIAVTGQLRRLW